MQVVEVAELLLDPPLHLEALVAEETVLLAIHPLLGKAMAVRGLSSSVTQ
jgi:hypothetical protein